MSRILLTVLAIALGIGASPALAEDKVDSIQPSSPWNVDFGDTKCRLARFFGEGENRHLLFLEQYRPEKTFGLTIAGPGLKRFRSMRRTSMQFFDGQEPKRTKPFKGDVGEFGDAVIYSTISVEASDESFAEDESTDRSLPQLDPEYADKVQFVSLRQGSREVRLATGPLGETFKVMNQCTQNMVKTWGLDVEKHLSAKRLPHWQNMSFVAKKIAGKYPKNALAQGEQGIFRLRVIIDETGAVTECVINNATIQDRLESPACREMEKARFLPAIDSEGRPFKSYYSTSIIYRANR